MPIIHADIVSLTTDNRPQPFRTPTAGFFSLRRDAHWHDRHYHDFNEIYCIVAGRAKLLIGTEHVYVQPRDIVLTPAGVEHDILEVYDDGTLDLFYLYEPGPDGGRMGHLHTDSEAARGHAVPIRSAPPVFR